MPKHHRIHLSPEHRHELATLIAAGTAAAQKLTHARILLKADEAEDGPGWTDAAIADAFDVSIRTVERVRARCATTDAHAALDRRPARNHKSRRFDGVGEAHLIALACSAPPEGRDRWTLRLLANRTVEWLEGDAASYETVRRTLKKTSSSPGSRSVG